MQLQKSDKFPSISKINFFIHASIFRIFVINHYLVIMIDLTTVKQENFLSLAGTSMISIRCVLPMSTWSHEYLQRGIETVYYLHKRPFVSNKFIPQSLTLLQYNPNCDGSLRAIYSHSWLFHPGPDKSQLQLSMAPYWPCYLTYNG